MADQAPWLRWLAGPAVRSCRVCSCTDYDCSGCIARTGRPCFWVGPRLCSACRQPADADAPLLCEAA